MSELQAGSTRTGVDMDAAMDRMRGLDALVIDRGGLITDRLHRVRRARHAAAQSGWQLRVIEPGGDTFNVFNESGAALFDTPMALSTLEEFLATR